MTSLRVTSAICTPLDPEDNLHAAGLRAHIAQQWAAGITGLLVGGTMGLMQNLDDAVYRDLAEQSIEHGRGRGEMFIGVGDTSLRRTLTRIGWVEKLGYDGLVCLAPFFGPSTQAELLDYYRALADAASLPLYLYDLPPRVGYAIQNETVLKLAEHPNIAGIKCSGPLPLARQLAGAVPEGFRVILAQPELLDLLVPQGYLDQLDGMYAVAPEWTMALVRHAAAGEQAEAAALQKKMFALRHLALTEGIWAVLTAVLNARGVEGRFAPRPAQSGTEADHQRVLAHPLVQDLLASAAQPTA